MMIKIVVFSFLFFLMFPLISAAIGVSPPEYKTFFVPNGKLVFSFNFVGDDEVDMQVILEGDLVPYAELSTKTIKGSGSVNVLLNLPDKLSRPGNHVLYVGTEQVNGPGGGLGIKGGMKATINIFVPFPGRYMDVSFNVRDAKKMENASYTIKFYSQGAEQVVFSPKIEVFDGLNKVVGNYNLPIYSINGSITWESDGEIPTFDYKSGVYKAVLTADYADRIASAEDTFRVGELFVNVSNHSDDLERNSINKFDVEIESFWNDPLENVFVDVNILDYNISFRTPSTNLAGFQKTWMSGFFDTRGIQEGEKYLIANISVHYNKQTTNVIDKVYFKGEKDLSNINYIIVIGIVIILIILMVIGYIIWKRRRN